LSIANVGIVLYVISEMMHNVKEAAGNSEEYEDASSAHDSQNIPNYNHHGNINKTCNNLVDISYDTLTKLRLAVRRSFDSIIDQLEGKGSDWDNSTGTVVVGLLFGILTKSLW